MTATPTGDAVVLVHGLAGDPSHMSLLADELTGHGYTVVCPVLAATGSGARAEEWVRVVEDAGVGLRHHRRVHLVGFSLGGLLAVIAARRTGGATITTVNAPIIVRDPLLYCAPASRRMALGGTGAAEPTAVPVRSAVELAKVMGRAHTVAPRLRRPALVVQSKADDVVHPVSAGLLARRLGPDAHILWLLRSGHDPFVGPEPGRLTAAVLDELGRAG